jgi:uncharacterized protein
MTEVDRHTVMIDVCRNCGGMWLDKGEMAKIVGQMREVEASVDAELNGIQGRERQTQYRPSSYQEHVDHHYEEKRHGYDHHDDHGYRKKTGFQKFFDIFD